MNILLISPGVNNKYNDNYYAYSHMCNSGDNILAITQRENINKGGRADFSPEIEIDGNFKIFRIFKTLKHQKSLFHNVISYYKVKKLLLKFKPDIIFCEELSSMILALMVKKHFNIPVVLRVEFFFDINYPFRTMGRILNLFRNRITGDYLSILLGSFLWRLACKHSNAVISCYFEDLAKLNSNNNSYFHYVPWPTSCPEITGKVCKVNKRGVFIGSFDSHKNLNEFLQTLPLLFKNTPLQEFWIVGTGDNLDIINKLKFLYPDKIKHIKSLSRNECLELIRNSYFSYSPALRGGWGFIGDSWAMRTPVVVTHNHYNFHDGVDSILTSPDLIVDRVNLLYSDVNLYNKILKGGFNRYMNNHTAESVGEHFRVICRSVINDYR